MIFYLGPHTHTRYVKSQKRGNVMFSPQGSDVEVEVPANLGKYTEALLAFTTHSSQVR